MRTFLWMILTICALQWCLPHLVPVDKVYHNRMDYNIVKNNVRNIDVSIEQVKRDIERKQLNHYLILLGDSVTYGSPGNSDQAVNAYMMQSMNARSTNTEDMVYNLALPGNQLGDLYAMLLKLERSGISTDYVLMNVLYANFSQRAPGDHVLNWMSDELRTLDPEAYARIQPIRGGTEDERTGLFEKYSNAIRSDLLPYFAVYAYKDYLYEWMKRFWKRLNGLPVPDDSVIGGDPRPWFQKNSAVLNQYLRGAEIRQLFSDKPFIMDEAGNIDVYFMNKIIAHMKGKRLTVVLSGINQTLMRTYIEKPGYRANLARIDAYFRSKPVHYMNLEGVIPDKQFVDHVHLTADGNQRLAEQLLPVNRSTATIVK